MTGSMFPDGIRADGLPAALSDRRRLAAVRATGLLDTGHVHQIDARGPLLGIVPGIQLADMRFRLAPGDALLLYADGTTEARERPGPRQAIRPLFGGPVMTRPCSSCASRPAPDQLDLAAAPGWDLLIILSGAYRQAIDEGTGRGHMWPPAAIDGTILARPEI